MGVALFPFGDSLKKEMKVISREYLPDSSPLILTLPHPLHICTEVYVVYRIFHIHDQAKYKLSLSTEPSYLFPDKDFRQTMRQ